MMLKKYALYPDPNLILDPELWKSKAGSGSGINHCGTVTLVSCTSKKLYKSGACSYQKENFTFVFKCFLVLLFQLPGTATGAPSMWQAARPISKYVNSSATNPISDMPLNLISHKGHNVIKRHNATNVITDKHHQATNVIRRQTS